MEWLKIFVPVSLIVVGAIVHIEVNLAVLKNDIKWIKKQITVKTIPVKTL